MSISLIVTEINGRDRQQSYKLSVSFLRYGTLKWIITFAFCQQSQEVRKSSVDDGESPASDADSAYKTVDFVKTEAFNSTREDAEASRSNMSWLDSKYWKFYGDYINRDDLFLGANWRAQTPSDNAVEAPWGCLKLW